jgi:hypothetical protein
MLDKKKKKITYLPTQIFQGRVLLNTNPMQESDTEKFRKRKIANKNLFMQRAVIFFSRGDFGESVAKGKQTIF